MEEEFEINSLQELKQAAFNGAVRGLDFQGWKQCYSWKQCYNKKEQNCALNLGKPGVHCALGWLIPWENQKHPHLQNGGNAKMIINDGILADPIQKYIRDPVNNGLAAQDVISCFFQDLQSAHDVPGSSMKKSFQTIQKKHGLIWPKGVAE